MKYFIAFIAGAAAGSAATWYLLKKKYEQIAQEEIDSVKERFTQPKVQPYEGPEYSEEAEKAAANHEKPDITQYAKMISHEGYTKYSNAPAEPSVEPRHEMTVEERATQKPYVITPEEFREFDDYTIISFMYYADGVLADEQDEKVEDIESSVGEDFADHFGEYDDDSVYIRNDRLKVDYGILRSQRLYSEVLQEKPYLREED